MGLTNHDAERVIIGSILLNPSCFDLVRKELDLNDFSLEKHRITYKGLLDIQAKREPLELAVLINELGNNGGLKKAGDRDYLISLVENISTSAAVSYHVNQVKSTSSLRNLNLLLLKGQDAIKDGTPFQDVIAQVEEGIDKLKEKYRFDKSNYLKVNDLLATKFDKQAQVIGKGILPEGGGLILAGESGVGKSILRTEIAIYLVMGWSIYELPVDKPKKVLIIQFENPASTEQYRLKQMLRVFQIESLSNNLIFSDSTIRFDLSLKRDRAKALELVKGSEADVIIWDPLSSLHSCDENDNIKMRSVLDSITEVNRKTNTSSIVLHHFGKSQELATEHRARGASSIRDWADTLIAMTQKSHKSQILRYLTFVKVRNGPEHRPILLQRDKQYFTHGIFDEKSLGNPQKVAEILEGLGGEVGSQIELIEALLKEIGCSKRSAKTYIKNATDKTIKQIETEEKTKGYVLLEI